MEHTDSILKQIRDLPPDWHLSGSVSCRILQAISHHAKKIGTIENSIETGSGKTTLLFSHLSSNHLVFALDGGNKSISAVKQSKLFNPENVSFIEGPTQRTLPITKHENKYDIALIDGPHAYPFPDLEYFFIYPYIETDGLLLLDDIHIPSVRRMFDIIKADDMFRLMEVVDDMAFFQRTDAALFNPYGDNWGGQGYNRQCWEDMKRVMHRADFLDKYVPKSLKERVPNPIKRWILNVF